MFYKKGVSENFAKFTRKHLCQSLFGIKVAGLSLAARDSGTAVFLCKFCEILMNNFSYRTPLGDSFSKERELAEANMHFTNIN